MYGENEAVFFKFQKNTFQKNNIFLIRKDWNFYDQILQAAAIKGK